MTRFHSRACLNLALFSCALWCASPSAANPSKPADGHPDFSGRYNHVLDVKANPAPDDGLPADPFVRPTPIGALPEGPAMNIRGESWQGDYHSPILRPWAAAWLKLVVGASTAGTPVVMPSNTLCNAFGVLYGWGKVNNLQILEEPDSMYFLFGPWPRTIHMNAQHPADLKPTSYGHSIGHWEGDTLVIDTVGMDGRTVIDRYQTPTTEALHIVERIRLRNEGKILQVNFWVEDKLALTHPWTSVSTYARAPARIDTATGGVCQEGLMAGHP